MMDIIVGIDADGDFCGDCTARPFMHEGRYEPCKLFGLLNPSEDSLCGWSDFEGRFCRCKACQDAGLQRFLLDKEIQKLEERLDELSEYP